MRFENLGCSARGFLTLPVEESLRSSQVSLRPARARAWAKQDTTANERAADEAAILRAHIGDPQRAAQVSAHAVSLRAHPCFAPGAIGAKLRTPAFARVTAWGLGLERAAPKRSDKEERWRRGERPSTTL